MSLNWRQFELGVLRPTLAEAAPVMPSPEVAVKLVGETCWHESDRLRALGQYPRDPNDVFGPGLGIASIERPTWNWMQSEDAYKAGLYGLLHYRHQYKDLAWNLKLNVIACRLRYFLDADPLPENTISARATYWWKVYNGGVVDRRPKYIADAKVIPWVK